MSDALSRILTLPTDTFRAVSARSTCLYSERKDCKNVKNGKEPQSLVIMRKTNRSEVVDKRGEVEGLPPRGEEAIFSSLKSGHGR